MSPKSHVKRQTELNQKLTKLDKEHKCIIRNVKNVLKKGREIFDLQSAKCDSASYLQSFPQACQDLDKLINLLVELNCNFESLCEDSDQDSFHSNDNIGCTNRSLSPHGFSRCSSRLEEATKVETKCSGKCVPDSDCNGTIISTVSTDCNLDISNGSALPCNGTIISTVSTDCNQDISTGSALPCNGTIISTVSTDCNQDIASGSALPITTSDVEPLPITSSTDVEQTDLGIHAKLCVSEPNIDSQQLQNLPQVEVQVEQLGATEEDNCAASLQPIPLAPVLPGEILEMRFTSGIGPLNFWLHTYCTKNIDTIANTLSSMYKTGCLCSLVSLPTVYDYVCGYNGRRFFRGQVLSVQPDGNNKGGVVSLLDVDNGEVWSADFHNIWQLDKNLRHLHTQAINCQLKGTPTIWFNELTFLFLNSLFNRMLVVTVCDKTSGNRPQFTVEIDSHCDSTSSKINVNEWVTKYVVPKLEQLQVAYNCPERFTEVLKSLDPFMLYNRLDGEEIDESKSIISPNLDVHSTSKNSFSNSEDYKILTPEKCQSDQLSQDTPEKHDLSCNTEQQSPSQCNISSVAPDYTVPQIELQYNSNFSDSVGLEFSVMISHIQSPNEFYVHIVCEDNTHISDLEDSMTQFYSENKLKLDTKEFAKQHIGRYCVSVFLNDSKWYRAEILDWIDESKDLVKIQYVDHGNQAEVKLEVIQPLWPCYTEYPIFAQRCHLALVCPPNSSKVTDIWPEHSQQEFRKILDYDKVYKIIVMKSLSKMGESLPVLLIDSLCSEQASINHHLLDNGFASELVQIETTSADQWDPMKEDFESARNSYTYDDEEACMAVSGYIPRDESRICRFFAANGSCYKGKACRMEHSRPHPDGWTTDKEAVFQDAFNRLSLPTEGQIIQINVSEILSINLFYAQLWDNPSSHTKTQDEYEVEQETLITLNNFLNTPQNVRKLKKLAVPPAIGQLVVAQFPQDGRWYRARVISSLPELGSVEVLFVDYGNKEHLDEKFIRDIEAKYLHLPFQAIECFLSNVGINESADEDVTLKAVHYFTSLTLYKTLQAKVIRRNESICQLEILLYATEGFDIGDSIVEQGLGVRKEYSIPRFSDSGFIPG